MRVPIKSRLADRLRFEVDSTLKALGYLPELDDSLGDENIGNFVSYIKRYSLDKDVAFIMDETGKYVHPTELLPYKDDLKDFQDVVRLMTNKVVGRSILNLVIRNAETENRVLDTMTREVLHNLKILSVTGTLSPQGAMVYSFIRT